MKKNSHNTDEITNCPICHGIARRFHRVVRAGRVGVCEKCGLWYRIPRPDLAELAEIYNKDYYRSWGMYDNEKSVHETKTAIFTPILDQLENLIPCPPVKRLLDVGAATGILLEVAEARGWEPFGLEINPYACSEMRNRFGEKNVFEGQLTECDFPSGYFGVITMTDVIEHVLDVKGTLRAAVNLLTDGGMLCITTPQIDSISRRLMRSQWFHFKQEHIQYFSRKVIQGVLEETGFDDIKISMYTKCLTLEYLTNQLSAFPHRILTPLVRAVHRIFPRSWNRCKMKLYGGEMLILARKSSRSGDV